MDALNSLGKGTLLFAAFLSGFLALIPLTYAAPTPAISCGTQTCYALKTDGTVWAWGSNTSGQLGDGNLSPDSVPVQVYGLSGVTAIAAGSDSGYALKGDGTVWAWGANGDGQLGNGSNVASSFPVQVTGLSGVSSLVVNGISAYALEGNGAVWAWGGNAYGQLGIGTNLSAITVDSNVPVRLAGLANVKSIGAGWNSAYALGQDGSIWIWGIYYIGSFMGGPSGPNQSNLAGTVKMSNFNGVASLIESSDGVNSLSFYAIKGDGTLWAWGNNRVGQLGDGSLNDQIQPVPVLGLTGGVDSLAANPTNGYALKSDGTVWAWGDGNYGQLGIGSGIGSDTPVQVAALSQVAGLTAGPKAAYALKTDGTVWSWGLNGEITSWPTQLVGLSAIKSITCPNQSCYAVKADGTVWTWGGTPYQTMATQVSGVNLQTPSPPGLGLSVILTAGSTSAQAGPQAESLPVAPVLQNGRVYVPLRFVSQALGAQVAWNASAQAVTITQNGKTVVMTEGKTSYKVNGQAGTMDAAPYLAASGYTMVPVRFVSQALGYQVSWDGSTQQVTITPGQN